ncbi:MAG: hypothetical protein ABL903_16635 [Methylococcales bacterium]
MKKSILNFILAVFLGASSMIVCAEIAVLSSAESITKTISNVENALVEVNKGDFSNANQQIRAARASAEHITGDKAIIKLANDSVKEGQAHSKAGNAAEAAKSLNESIKLYKSL